MPQIQLIMDAGRIVSTYSWTHGNNLLRRSTRAGIKHIISGTECEPSLAGIRKAIHKELFEEALTATEYFDDEITSSKDSSRLRWATELMTQVPVGDPVLKYKLCIYFKQFECARYMANQINNSKNMNLIKEMLQFDIKVNNLKEGQQISDLL